MLDVCQPHNSIYFCKVAKDAQNKEAVQAEERKRERTRKEVLPKGRNTVSDRLKNVLENYKKSKLLSRSKTSEPRLYSPWDSPDEKHMNKFHEDEEHRRKSEGSNRNNIRNEFPHIDSRYLTRYELMLRRAKSVKGTTKTSPTNTVEQKTSTITVEQTDSSVSTSLDDCYLERGVVGDPNQKFSSTSQSFTRKPYKAPVIPSQYTKLSSEKKSSLIAVNDSLISVSSASILSRVQQSKEEIRSSATRLVTAGESQITKDFTTAGVSTTVVTVCQKWSSFNNAFIFQEASSTLQLVGRDPEVEPKCK